MPFRRSFLLGLTALVLAPFASFAADLPNLNGKTVVVVTENAYPPATMASCLPVLIAS